MSKPLCLDHSGVSSSVHLVLQAYSNSSHCPLALAFYFLLEQPFLVMGLALILSYSDSFSMQTFQVHSAYLHRPTDEKIHGYHLEIHFVYHFLVNIEGHVIFV